MGWGQRGPLLLPAEVAGLGFTGFAEEATFELRLKGWVGFHWTGQERDNRTAGKRSSGKAVASMFWICQQPAAARTPGGCRGGRGDRGEKVAGPHHGPWQPAEGRP